MVTWLIVGLSIVCICIWYLLFMFSTSKGKHMTIKREQKLPSRNTVNVLNINDLRKGVKKDFISSTLLNMLY